MTRHKKGTKKKNPLEMKGHFKLILKIPSHPEHTHYTVHELSYAIPLSLLRLPREPYNWVSQSLFKEELCFFSLKRLSKTCLVFEICMLILYQSYNYIIIIKK